MAYNTLYKWQENMNFSNARLRIAGFIVAALIVAFDQWTKLWIITTAQTTPMPIKIFNFFDIVLVFNRGVSFGMMANAQNLMAAALPIGLSLITLILIVWLLRAKDRLVIFALGLIIGGAVGNLIDRARSGSVTDFLDFHIGGYHWPAFNVADSAIFIGVVIFMLTTLVQEPVVHHE